MVCAAFGLDLVRQEACIRTRHMSLPSTCKVICRCWFPMADDLFHAACFGRCAWFDDFVIRFVSHLRQGIVPMWADSRLRRTALPSRERIPHCSGNDMQNKFADTLSVRGKFFQDVTNAGRPLLRGYVGQSSKVYAWDKSAADLCESTRSRLRSLSCSLSVGSCCGPDYVVRRLLGLVVERLSGVSRA